MRKPAFCICENKDADREADQRLCFCYINNTISLLPKSSFYPSVVAQPGLCRTWSETPKTGFVVTRLIFARGISQFDGIVMWLFKMLFLSLLEHITGVWHMGAR